MRPLLTPVQAACEITGETQPGSGIPNKKPRYLRDLADLPYVKVGKFVMYRPEDVEAYVEARLHGNRPHDEPEVAARQQGRRLRRAS